MVDEAVLDLVDELETLDVQLTLEGEQLRYSAPKGGMDAALLGRMKTHKPGILALLRERAQAAQRLAAPIPVQARDSVLPLSFAQQRFWFLDQMAGGNSPIYNMLPIVMRVDGVLEVKLLQGIMDTLVARHHVLSNRFTIEGDAPRQWPEQGGSVPIGHYDFSGLLPEEAEAAIATAIREEGERPFDLTQGAPLLRLGVIRRAPAQHVLVLTMHHIVGDGWSMGILVAEFSQLYRARQRNVPVTLPPLPIQYGDFAAWERKRLSGLFLQQQIHFWRRELSGAPTLLELPTDRPRPRLQSYNGTTYSFLIDRSLTIRIQQTCNRAGVTPFMLLLSAFGVLLSRYTGQEDLVIGTPLSVRAHAQCEGLIGLFLNTLPLRLDLSGNPSFTELLQRTRKHALAAYQHGEVPFEDLLQALHIDRALNHTPLFQVLFALQNAPFEPIDISGLSITPLETENTKAPFDLVLSMEEGAEGIGGRFRYNTDLFDQGSIVRLADHFLRLLDGALTDGQQPVGLLPLLSDAEQRAQQQWRGGNATFPVQETLVDLFERQVALRPTQGALVCEDLAWTYEELNERANRIAHRLVRLGVQPGDRVGLCMQRSADLVAALLGILKSGAAYVPLDPTYPADRLSFMAEDAALDVVVTDPTVSETIPSVIRQRVDVTAPDLAAEPTTNLSLQLDLGVAFTAYVIYTSGSTGRPKGVGVSHENVVRLFYASESIYGFTERDVWTLFHSYAFDFSVWEIWGALLYGGRLVVVPYWVSRSPDAFFDLLQSQQVTVLNQTPSAFRQLMEIDRRDGGRKTALQWVIFGGEALELKSLEGWCGRHGFDKPQLVNMYGITETTVHVTYHRITADDLAHGSSVIGQPLPDLTLDLRDRHNQPVPFGVAGEILVGGAGVAQGYLNRPELTRERFVDAKMLGMEGQKIYRSGDLARRRVDGQLDYLGRMDQQVKIRGFRIELGEIQNQMAAYPGVTGAVVTVHTGLSGPELLGYVAFQEGVDGTVAVNGLRDQLRTRLPDYMVPATLVALERMPLTANGKIDLRALPKPDRDQRTRQTAFVAPTTPLEKLLAELWQEVLQLKEVGCQDHFFELGGNSIKGAIFANRMQEKIGSVFYVVALFEAPTIAELIAYMRVHYPEAVRRYEGDGSVAETDHHRLNDRDWTAFRSVITPLPACARCTSGPKNRRAIFVLAPPRSGTTLLRVLLGGHPQLFAPPELELMPFNTLGERERICSGRDAFWLEGTLRAVMALRGVSADDAKALMAVREAADKTVKDFYAEMQGWLGDRLLVDKSPSYILDRSILDRMEATFEVPLYIHLHRHPYGMINSFEEAKLHQIFFRYPHSFTSRALAELIWTHSHQNVLDFFTTVPADRQIDVGFEAITANPQQEMERLCAFMGLPFDPSMLALYEEKQKKKRMTDGLHAESKMLGDVKFHTHQGIDASVNDRWRERYQHDFLCATTWRMAERLGYPAPKILADEPAPTQTTPTQSTTWASLIPAASTERTHALRELSLAQQRLWFFDQLEGSSNAYNMPVALWLDGTLDRPALLGALEAIGQRHEVLQSTFVTVEGEARCHLLEALPPPMVIDLTLIDPRSREAEAQRWLVEESERAFDLTRGPLFRARLVVVNPERHLLLLNMHHIVADGWSLGIVAHELAVGYQARHRKQTPSLPRLPLQYGEYARWQRQWLSGGELARQIEYWRQQLADSPALLDLPTDRVRPALQSYRGATLNFVLEKALCRDLRRFADDRSASLYMVLLTAFGVLLYRYSGQTIVPIGSPSANRSRREIESLIGFFVNTLVMKVNIDPTATFDQLLAAVRMMALDAYAHQEVSFEQLVEVLQPARNLSYSPIFQVMLTMRNAPLVLPVLDDLRVSAAEHENPIAKYDLTLSFGEADDALEGSLEYNCDLFDAWRMKQLIDHLSELLRQVVVAPTQSVASLRLLKDRDRQRLLVDANRTERVWSGPLSVHQWISDQAQAEPDRTALCWGDQTLSYGALEKESNQLAHSLLEHGVRRGDRVAVALERTGDLVIALLAVLKTGGCYVPLDPGYPADRVAMILHDAGSRWLITNRRLQPLLPDAPHTLLMDTHSWANAPDSLPTVAVGGEDLAYVIFTSGSTGRPKGVMLPHRAIVNFLHSMIETPGMGASDTILAVTTIAFDIAVLELWAPLAIGARVVIASETEVRDGAALLALLDAWQVTILQATPATWRLLLAAGWEGTPGLKALCGGEALPRSLAVELHKRCQELWNMYGPTETAVWSTVARVDGTGAGVGPAEPIGRPIANTRVYLLDDQREPVPRGVTGELYIGGHGVALGYLGQPDLTQERFLADPFVAGAWMYRTGDSARTLANGDIEYLGRLDQQVKLRGFRIELSEIEHSLQQHPAMVQCAVIIDGREEAARLVAFCVANPMPEAAVLRGHLAARLPEYMVPSLFVPLDALPLTPNGKIDRKALRVPEALHTSTPRHTLAPRDQTELRLVTIWQEVLGRSPIGIEDNFFALGGHSLVAVRLMARIAAEFGRHLPLAALFQASTVAALARWLRAEATATAWQTLVPLSTTSDTPQAPLFCVAGAGGNVLYLQPLTAALRGAIPLYGLQPPGLDGVTPVLSSVEALADAYLSALRTIQPTGPYRLLGHSFGGLVTFVMAKRLHAAHESVERLILLDTAAPQWFAPTGRDWGYARWLAQVAQIASHQYGVSLDLTEEAFAVEASEEAQLRLLQERLIACGVLPEQADVNHLRGFIDVYRANLQAVYQPPEGSADIPTLLVRSAELQPGQLQDPQARAVRAEADLGWGRWISGSIEMVEVPGDHLTMLNPPDVLALAAEIRRSLVG